MVATSRIWKRISAEFCEAASRVSALITGYETRGGFFHQKAVQLTSEVAAELLSETADKAMKKQGRVQRTFRYASIFLYPEGAYRAVRLGLDPMVDEIQKRCAENGMIMRVKYIDGYPYNKAVAAMTPTTPMYISAEITPVLTLYQLNS